MTRARESVRGLVQMNDQLSVSKAQLDAELKKLVANAARLNEENMELSSKVNSLLLVSDQRDYLFRENQRLLKEVRERQ